MFNTQNIQVTTPLYSPWLCPENRLSPSNFQQKDRFNEEWARSGGSTCTDPCEDEVPCRDTWAELGALRSRVWYLPWSTELTPPTPALPWAWGLSTHPSLLDWAEDVIASNYWVFSLPVSQLTSAHMLLQAPQSKPAGLASTFKQQFFDNQIILTETS